MKPILFCLLFHVLAEGRCILEELPRDDCPTWTHPVVNGADASYHVIMAVKKHFNKKLKLSKKLKSLVTKSTMDQDPLLEN